MHIEEKFRSVFFGGYNKEDVTNYVQAMENSIQSIKSRYDNEIEELKRQLEEVKRENEGLKTGEGVPKYVDVSQESNEEQLREQLEEAWKTIQALQKIENTEEKHRELEEELIQLKEKKKIYEENFHAISKVLSDARDSAHSIEQEARKKAQDILKQAEKEGQELINQKKRQIDKELEDKGIRLMAAKYKIESYREEMNTTQQKFYNLYLDLGKMVDEMPQHLEQLWEGDEYLPVTAQISQKRENK